MGYHRAGFDVVGVDIAPQPHYPFEFWQGRAEHVLDHWVMDYDLIHASPPCQWGTAYRRRHNHVKPSENVIPELRQALLATKRPYIIEQPENNRTALIDPITLCGSSFGLDVRRHRCFETPFEGFAEPIGPPPCDHGWQSPRFPPATNRTNLRKTVEVGVWRISLEVQRGAMGIDWMTRAELSQAIPPAYTKWLGGVFQRL